MNEHSMEHVMARILEVRYTDLEEEKRLCQELFTWSKDKKDVYAEAFSYTYLGDYYIAQNDGEKSGVYLIKAQELLEEGEAWDKIRLRVYSLLGLFYDMHADEQRSVQSYLDAIIVAQRLKDIPSECIILNNLGNTFQRHKNYQVALEYYDKAYQYRDQLDGLVIQNHIFSNLVDLSIDMGDFEKAQGYITEGDLRETDLERREVSLRKNWCCYYAAAGDTEKAEQWAQSVLEKSQQYNDNRFDVFENYNKLCEGMLKIKSKKYAKAFLELMEDSNGGALDRSQALEERWLEYILCFEPEELHAEAYKRFYRADQEFRTRVNKTVVNAMKSKIQLKQLTAQNRELQLERQDLERQANRDEMTGLFNRRYLNYLTRNWARGNAREPIGVVMVDVDYFKEYNDFYGHIEGDEVLKVVAKCLQDCGGEGVYPCRFGGDEFTCLCEGMNTQEIEGYIKKVQDTLFQRNLKHEKSPCSDRITISIGCSTKEEHREMGIYFLLQMADKALYESKLSGRNTYKRR